MQTDRFFLEFKNNQTQLTLEFELVDNSTAVKWYQSLVEQLTRNNQIYERDRIRDFPNDNSSKNSLIQEMNTRIDTINQWKPCIPYKLDTGVNQEILNNLHKYYEDIKGGCLNVPSNVKQALEEYNILIHGTEHMLNTTTSFPRIVITFQDTVRQALEPSDYDNFELDVKFGQVYVNYCELGKQLWDVFKDRDKQLDGDHIRPLKWYSPDMHMFFRDSNRKRSLPEFWNWFDRNQEKLNSLGFYKQDKKLALGYIPVAKIKTDLDNQTLIETIAQFNQVNRVYI